MSLAVSSEQEAKLTRVLADYLRVKEEGTLHLIPYTTLFDYMFYLREICRLLEPIGSKAFVYLAAAVSDFYVGPSDLVSRLKRQYAQDSSSCTQLWFTQSLEAHLYSLGHVFDKTKILHTLPFTVEFCTKYAGQYCMFRYLG